MKKLPWLVVVASLCSWGVDGATLTKQKCGRCHMLQTPRVIEQGKYIAPPFDAVGFHLKEAIEDAKAQKEFIMDYVLHPDASKSVCESNKVAHYGVMPSMKGEVSTEELSLTADYIVANYPHESFKRLIREMLTNDTLRTLRHSPFLINDEGLPHFTKLLMQNWDKAKLGLTDEQKKRLLAVRKETISAIKAIKFKLQPLEEEVVEAMKEGEDPKRLEPALEKIAKLKLEATRIHLRCIADTLAVLNEEQVETLLPFWQ